MCVVNMLGFTFNKEKLSMQIRRRHVVDLNHKLDVIQSKFKEIKETDWYSALHVST